jgi:hypothetical protein
MDTKHFELLLRRTRFCGAILFEIWDGLTLNERIDLLLHLGQFGSAPKELLKKAVEDSNPVIRMLAVKSGYISEGYEPELYSKLRTDKSPFVKAALNDTGFFTNTEDEPPLSHMERLGIIALSTVISEESFANYITEGLESKKISEDEAAELVTEFVRNPNYIKSLYREPMDGLDHYTIHKEFEAIWNLTTCTPIKVHSVIAWEYPLEISDVDFVPDELLDRMSQYALEAVAFRQHIPLLKRIEENPDQFDKKILDAAHNGAEFDQKDRKTSSGIDELRNEFSEFRAELQERLDALTQLITEAASRRRGFFS